MKRSNASFAAVVGMPLLVAAVVSLLMQPRAEAATLTSAPFGTTLDHVAVTRYTMTGNSGVRVSFMSYGGVITDVTAPDRQGHLAPVTLGFQSLRDYETIGAQNEYYFGGLLGRDTNWIKKGRFTLDGQAHQITLTDPPNTIHGGKRGFDKRVWAVQPLITSGPTVSARLTYISPDGEEGFPGTVTAIVTYSLSDDGALTIRYQATTDKATIVNMSSHLSFNLAGAGSPAGILSQELAVDADYYIPLDREQIPLGTIAPVENTPFDFHRSTLIASRIHDKHPQLTMADGYDHYWVLNKKRSDAGPQLAARVVDPHSGRTLEVLTTQPGVQIYAGGFFSGNTVGVGGRYVKYAAFTMETQGYPEAINHPGFKSSVLRPGELYDNTTVFRFGATRQGIPLHTSSDLTGK